jgi:hypothetical protein
MSRMCLTTSTARALTWRATSLSVGIAAAIGLWVLGSIFGLNGQQWAWWRWASYAEGGLVLLVASIRSVSRIEPVPRVGRPAVAAGGFAGALLLVLSVAVMAHRYSDPYSGSLFWPHALALTTFVGLTLLVVSAAFLTRPHHHT